MKKVFEYFHLGGLEILKVRYPHIQREIDEIIESIKITSRTKVSREKTKRGKLLYSPIDMNRAFKTGFCKREYKELKDFYSISTYDGRHDINAFKQIDFERLQRNFPSVPIKVIFVDI